MCDVGRESIWESFRSPGSLERRLLILDDIARRAEAPDAEEPKEDAEPSPDLPIPARVFVNLFVRKEEG